LRTAFLSALVPALAACGSSLPAKTVATAKPPTLAKPAKLDVKSAVMAGERIPARYTCDGQGVSPPLEWGAVPLNVRQLALFLVGFRPKPGTKKYKVSVEWAVAGLKPTLHRLDTGQLPAGAHVGVASGGSRYTLCPANGTTVHYQFELYGVPASVSIPAHFSGLSLLDRLTLPSGPTRADAHGGFVAIYSRA
jgi:phosphatidylethanolamine-binding protein (PEBP) family uncharacterized protein